MKYRICMHYAYGIPTTQLPSSHQFNSPWVDQSEVEFVHEIHELFGHEPMITTRVNENHLAIPYGNLHSLYIDLIYPLLTGYAV
jgi:hypothetical protein